MFKNTKAFNGFSVDDIAKAKEFYGEVLGIDVSENQEMQMLTLNIPNTNGTIIYPKPDHKPATYTILNFPVDDIDEAVVALKKKGVTFEHYEGMTDEDGIARGKEKNMGPDIAWFTDPAGNILSVLEAPDA